jgi:NAD(P)-dependent dehydrogenase (short-subunit alcohol dehydrogenase family)
MLKGKVILVAGAGGVLGAALVHALLGAGASVIATDLRLENLRRIFQPLIRADTALYLQLLDISDRGALSEFLKGHDRLDGAVNCTYPRNQRYGAHFFDVTLADFNENVALHLGSHFQFMQACGARFVKTSHPFSLVNISSIYGAIAPKFQIYQDTPMTMPVEYAAIKAALVHLTKYTAAYVADSRFRVNCVSPGGLLDGQPQEFQDAYRAHTLGAGMLNAQDIVGTILFLLSDHSKFLNGQNIVVDDGFTL